MHFDGGVWSARRDGSVARSERRPTIHSADNSIHKCSGCKPLAGHASAVVHRAGLHFELVIVGNDHSTFACSNQLAGLKAEGARDAERSDALPSLLPALRKL